MEYKIKAVSKELGEWFDETRPITFENGEVIGLYVSEQNNDACKYCEDMTPMFFVGLYDNNSEEIYTGQTVLNIETNQDGIVEYLVEEGRMIVRYDNGYDYLDKNFADKIKVMNYINDDTNTIMYKKEQKDKQELIEVE